MIEVMVAGGVAAILGLGVMSMTRMSTRSVANVRQNSDYQVLLDTIQKIIARPDWCAGAFRDVSETGYAKLPAGSNSVAVSEIRMGGGAAAPFVAQVGKELSPGLKVSAITLSRIVESNNPKDYPAAPLVHPGYLQTDVQLTIQAARDTTRAYGAQRVGDGVPPIPFTIYADKMTGSIKSCSPPPILVGCLNTAATNYQVTANQTCPNGGKGTPTPNPTESALPNGCACKILGCTDPAATNYNANATVDNGTCVFPTPTPTTTNSNTTYDVCKMTFWPTGGTGCSRTGSACYSESAIVLTITDPVTGALRPNQCETAFATTSYVGGCNYAPATVPVGTSQWPYMMSAATIAHQLNHADAQAYVDAGPASMPCPAVSATPPPSPTAPTVCNIDEMIVTGIATNPWMGSQITTPIGGWANMDHNPLYRSHTAPCGSPITAMQCRADTQFYDQSGALIGYSFSQTLWNACPY